MAQDSVIFKSTWIYDVLNDSNFFGNLPLLVVYTLSTVCTSTSLKVLHGGNFLGFWEFLK